MFCLRIYRQVLRQRLRCYLFVETFITIPLLYVLPCIVSYLRCNDLHSNKITGNRNESLSVKLRYISRTQIITIPCNDDS